MFKMKKRNYKEKEHRQMNVMYLRKVWIIQWKEQTFNSFCRWKGENVEETILKKIITMNFLKPIKEIIHILKTFKCEKCYICHTYIYHNKSSGNQVENLKSSQRKVDVIFKWVMIRIRDNSLSEKNIVISPMDWQK